MDIISKEEAKNLGLKRYFTGIPCKKGHVCERYVKSKGCVECDKLISSKWKKDNPESNRRKAKRWRDSNPEKTKEINKKGYQKCLKENTTYKLAHNLRRRFYVALKKEYKNGSAIGDLGCSVEFLKRYLESKFDENMSWENYGKYWQIDHIVPFMNFDLKDNEQVKKVCHYTNLQPLSITEHKKKSLEERKIIKDLL